MRGREEFRQAVEQMTESWLWELHNHMQDRIPDPVDYLEMRRETFGADLTLCLTRIGHGNRVPPEVYRTTMIQGMQNAVMDYAVLVNDLFLYQKEIEYEGERLNGVLAVQHLLGCGRDEAVAIVVDLMGSRLHQFERTVETGLPALCEEHGLDEGAREILDGYVTDLWNWTAGILKWHRATSRYREADLRERYSGRRSGASAEPVRFVLPGPNGLGTSATRIRLPLPAGPGRGGR